MCCLIFSCIFLLPFFSLFLVAIIINPDITIVIFNSNNLVGIHVLNFILSYNFILSLSYLELKQSILIFILKIYYKKNVIE